MNISLHKRLGQAMATPWNEGFIPLMRHFSVAYKHLPFIGQAQRPQQEPFRLGQEACLAFAPREIAQIRLQQGRFMIRLFGLGMLGPNGALPLHVTERVREDQATREDHTLGDFLDMFHHRAFSHFYRAWFQAQAAAGLDRADRETFTPYIARLAGDEPDEVIHSALPTHARWACAPHRIRQARNPEGLSSSISRFFGVKVQLLEYQLHWIDVNEQDQCQLGCSGRSSMLGAGAIAGDKVPDRQSKFRLAIGPLDLEQYLRFVPSDAPDSVQGRDLPALVELVQAFVGFEYLWDVELFLHFDCIPCAVLGGEEQLGRSTWLQPDPPVHRTPRAIAGMVFEPR